MLLDSLDERLEPEIQVVETGPDRSLDETLAEFRDLLVHRAGRRAQLMRQGAIGMISQVALNAIAHHGSIEATLRRFAGEWRF